MMKKIFIYVLAVLSIIVFCGLSYASSGGGHETSMMDWVWRFVNFGILVAVLVIFLGKPMKEYFKQRTELIERSIKEASDAKAAAEKALKEVEDKLTLKEQEIDKIMDAAKRTGEADRDRMISDGEKMSEKIREQARVNIDQELKNAREQLKADAAMLSLEIAEKKIKDKISKDDQIKILEESLKKIEGQNG
ncbi:MAG: F0F1 ATP synthase subunit B [Nitrospirota bacterium]|nr:MAG: F0F1 ATP synthase subunit B [Nitrospirota bacterium]